MKARVKETGEIVEVIQCAIIHDDGTYEIMRGTEIDEVQEDPDYWTRLEHQAAIAAMGGICGNTSYAESTWEEMAEDAILAAHFFVQKLRKKEERK